MEKTLKINKLPSPSWSWLKINDATIDFDFTLENVFPSVKNISSVQYSKESSFVKKDFPELLSGTGKDSLQIFKDSKPECFILPKNTKLEKPVVLNYDFSQSQNAVTGQLIVAEENSEGTIIIVSSSQKEDVGFQALKTEVFAKEGSKLKIIKVQLLGNSFIQVDDTSSYVKENASVELLHVELGGAKVYVGSGCTLKEYKSSFKSNMAYYLKDEQLLDLNFIVNHFGKKTSCKMKVSGSLNGKSKKTYRGTIDFKKGCSGSDGDEQEETLLLSPTAENYSMPVILCTEEDISGEHGATIGRLTDEILFYMQTRGISRENAEKIIARSKVQSLLSVIQDEDTVKKIEEEMDGIFGKAE